MLFGFAGCAFLFSAFLLADVIALFNKSSIIPSSDYIHLLVRYMAYLKGDVDFASFVFSKHVDHNHALVYFVSYFDIVWGSGDLKTLSYGQFFANLGVFLLYVYLVYVARFNWLVSVVCAVFVSSQIFSLYSMELWVFPFQFVLASYRLLLIGGIVLFCHSLFAGHLARLKYICSLVLLLIATLSHGSGILIPPLLCAICLVVWLRSGRRFTRLEILFLAVFFVAFFVHEVVYTSKVGAFGILRGVHPGEWTNVPRYLAYLLGHSFAWDANAHVKIFAGALGIALYLLLVLALLRKWARPVIELPLIAIGAVSLSAALLSVLINLGYAEFRGVQLIHLDYFLSSRYMATVSGFWLSLALLAFIWLSMQRHWFWREGGKVLLCFICLASAISSTFIQGFSSGTEWERTVLSQGVTEKYLRSWGAGGLEQKVLTERLYIPESMYSTALHILEFQKENNLGVFADSASYLDAVDDSLVGLDDENWEAGISRATTDVLVANTKANLYAFTPGTKIEFRSGVREILKQEPSSVYLVLTLGHERLIPNLDGYPNKFKVIN